MSEYNTLFGGSNNSNNHSNNNNNNNGHPNPTSGGNGGNNSLSNSAGGVVVGNNGNSTENGNNLNNLDPVALHQFQQRRNSMISDDGLQALTHQQQQLNQQQGISQAMGLSYYNNDTSPLSAGGGSAAVVVGGGGQTMGMHNLSHLNVGSGAVHQHQQSENSPSFRNAKDIPNRLPNRQQRNPSLGGMSGMFANNLGLNTDSSSIPVKSGSSDAVSGGRRGSIPKAPKLYALRIAAQPGIYHNWNLAKSLIDGCPGAKYKGFVTVDECMHFIWQGFPQATFTMNEHGDYIMNDPEPVFKAIEEARQKKEKTSGILLRNDTSAFDPSEPNAEHISSLFHNSEALRLTLNPEQNLALDLAKKSENIFVTGSRKMGKQVLLAHIYDYLVTSKKLFHITSASIITAQSSDSTFTLAWTGMGKALGTRKQILSKVRKNTQARKMWAEISVLVINECSMLSAFLFDTLDFLGKQIRKNLNVPFGGIQVILVGDTHGYVPLSPQIVCCPTCGNSQKFGALIGPSAPKVGSFLTCVITGCRFSFLNSWNLYPFESPLWDEAKIKFIQLEKSYEPDVKLQTMFKKLAAPPFDQQVIDIINERMLPQPQDDDINVTVVCSNDTEMNDINLASYNAIPHETQHRYESIDTVLNNFDFSSRAQQKEGLIDEFIDLKVGTRVLVLEDGNREYTTGEVVDFGALGVADAAQCARMQSMGIPQLQSSLTDWLSKNPMLPQIRLENGEVKTISCRVWVISCYGRAASWRVQLPIRLAYAISLGKAHEVVLSNILITKAQEWLAGEMYMALSLAKTFESIYLENITSSNFVPDPRVLAFVGASVHGQVSKSVKMSRTAEDGFFIQNITTTTGGPSSLKRHSVSGISGGGSGVVKKRRPSKAAPIMPSFVEEVGFNRSGSGMIQDPNLIRYQQMSQRRHSYQPLTSYQEQQYLVLQSQQHQNSMMDTASNMMSFKHPDNLGVFNGGTMQVQQGFNNSRFEPYRHQKSLSGTMQFMAGHGSPSGGGAGGGMNEIGLLLPEELSETGLPGAINHMPGNPTFDVNENHNWNQF